MEKQFDDFDTQIQCEELEVYGEQYQDDPQELKAEWEREQIENADIQELRNRIEINSR